MLTFKKFQQRYALINDKEELLKLWYKSGQEMNDEIEKRQEMIDKYKDECEKEVEYFEKVKKEEGREPDDFNKGRVYKAKQFLKLVKGDSLWKKLDD